MLNPVSEMSCQENNPVICVSELLPAWLHKVSGRIVKRTCASTVKRMETGGRGFGDRLQRRGEISAQVSLSPPLSSETRAIALSLLRRNQS